MGHPMCGLDFMYGPPVHGPPVLSEFCVVFQRNLADLFLCKLLWRRAGRGAGVTEEAVEAGGGDDPEEEEFVVGVVEAMPGVFRDEEG